MQPEFHILVQDGEGVGTRLSELRVALVKSIFEDQPLRALLVNEHGVTYQGAATAFGAGRQMTAFMSLRLGFTYLMQP